MKLHFEPNLDYQMQAIEAVCDLFRGQEVCRTEFTVTMKAPMPVGGRPFSRNPARANDPGPGRVGSGCW